MKDSVALVSGGASGIGAATVRALVRRGARVVLSDIQTTAGIALAAELGERVRCIEHDVSRADDWARVIAATEAAFGPVTALVNNAGIAQIASPVQECSERDYRRVIEVNQISVFLGMQAVVPSMRRAGGGAIVNVSSAMGLVATPGAIAYVASKFAVTGMTKAAAADLGGFGIRVNSVHPGLVETPIMDSVDPQALAALRQFAATLPLQRVGRADEIAQLVVFLCSDASSYCTGGAYTADAGWTAL